MRVFVLNTGKCGSTTFFEACKHITNYTCGHETNTHKLIGRLIYPDNHIEIDNRLIFFFGELESHYPNAYYVHLIRNTKDCVNSLNQRWMEGSINRAFLENILMTSPLHWTLEMKYKACENYYYTTNMNIANFLKDKKHIFFQLEQPQQFRDFIKQIAGIGNIDKAINEFKFKYNQRIK